jgi:hypothetical protein
VQLVRFATLANRERRNGANNEFTGRMHIPDRAKEKSQDIHIVRVSRKNFDNPPLFDGVIENIRKDITWLMGGVKSKKMKRNN